LTRLLRHLEERRSGGRKLLVPYLMGGAPDEAGFLAAAGEAARHADAVEIGLPYSDPLMDGPVIVDAGERALRSGTGPVAALEMSAAAPEDPPRVVMTYYNPIHMLGEVEFCRRAAKCGATGLIVPDLPLEESRSLRRAAAEEDLAWIPLVAPTTSEARTAELAATATGFVYAVSTLGVTGERSALSARAAAVATRCKAATDAPVLVGIGVSTPAQAREAAGPADGVVIGSAVVRLVLEEGAAAAGGFLASVRAALDSRPG